MQQFANVNYLAVLVAAAAAWIIGAVWYGVFGKAWVAAQGKSMDAFKQEQTGKAPAVVLFAIAFLANLIMAFVLYGVMTHVGPFTIRSGVISGALIWFGFVITTMAVNNAFQGRKSMLTVIDAGHWLAVLLLSGAILGAFGG